MVESKPNQAKLDKLSKLKEKGVNPYPNMYCPNAFSGDLQKRYADLGPDEERDDDIIVAGRVMAIRNSGMFIDLYDRDGKIQIYTHESSTKDPEAFELLKFIDVGDIIGVEGGIKKTKRGELSILTKRITILAKSLELLPEKYHGLTDVEARYRQRYVDLIMNQDSKEALEKRSRIVAAVREFLNDKNFLEVETPMLHSIMGGANAKPFITHYNSLHSDFFLRVSPELFLKRLIVGGFDRVYEINRNFRNEGIDTKHVPEFTMLELYQSYADYNDIMKLVEDMFEFVAMKVNGTTVANWRGHEINLKGPYARKTMVELANEALGIDLMKMNDAEAMKVAKEKGIKLKGSETWGEVVEAVFDQRVEGNIVQPLFVLDHPKDISPLTKTHRENPRLVERFELFINQTELGNAYTELTDPLDQKARFEDQVAKKEKGDDEAQMMDTDFVCALGYGMPPTGGLGVGIDRLVMLLTGANAIRDVILFPALKDKN